MGRRLYIARKVLTGEVHDAARHARASPVSVDRVREAFDELVDEGILYHVHGNYYVVADLNEDERQAAVSQIREVSAELSRETDDTTTVTVSGALMEDATFETDADPSEIIR